MLAPIGYSSCADWKKSACSVGSRRHCAAGLMEVDAHLTGTDNDAARVIPQRCCFLYRLRLTAAVLCEPAAPILCAGQLVNNARH